MAWTPIVPPSPPPDWLPIVFGQAYVVYQGAYVVYDGKYVVYSTGAAAPWTPITPSSPTVWTPIAT